MKFLHNPGLKVLKRTFLIMLKMAAAAETKCEHETDMKSSNSSCTLTEDKAKPFSYSKIKVLLIQVMGKTSSEAVRLMGLRISIGLKQDGNFQVVHRGKMSCWR